MILPRSKSTRTGSSHIGLFAVGSLVLLALVMFLMLYKRTPSTGQDPLTLYCAAGLKGPVTAIAKAYEAETGQPVQISFGGSGTLLANLEVSKSGDLYLPADDSYIDLVRQKGLAREALPAAQMQAVLAVKKGNPGNIRSLEDLRNADIKLSMANPEAAAVGKLARKALEDSGEWKDVEPRITVYKPTVNEVATDIKLGTVDGGIIWDALLGVFDDLEAVPVDALTNATARITVTVLESCEQPQAALRFARYLNAPEKGFKIWEENKFQGIEGDPWAMNPVLTLYSGAMLRPAIEKTLTNFIAREGVEITPIYNGCGILVSQMRADLKANAFPDAYFSCDTSFMTDVEDLFLDSEDISANRMVIVVPKGNPKKIEKLGDLARPGLRVGLGHPKKSALGALTERALKEDGSHEAIMKQVTVESATGDFLVNQIMTGSLDVIIVYITNASMNRDNLEIIPIEMDAAWAVQPIAVSRTSKHKMMMERLIASIKSSESKTDFESFGFNWKVAKP